jgi:hypothetical protein
MLRSATGSIAVSGVWMVIPGRVFSGVTGGRVVFGTGVTVSRVSSTQPAVTSAVIRTRRKT